jgi:ribosome-associated toxin RatA of RatAB toxin-antitoxin module
LIAIKKTRDIVSSVDRVWKIISNTDEDQKYWTNIREIKVLSRDGDTIEREAKVGPRAFSQTSRQTLVLDAKRSIKLTLTGESIMGGRTIALVPVGENATRIDVAWEFELKDVPGFVQSIVKNQISKATDEALSKIAAEAERGTSPVTGRKGVAP